MGLKNYLMNRRSDKNTRYKLFIKGAKALIASYYVTTDGDRYLTTDGDYYLTRGD